MIGSREPKDVWELRQDALLQQIQSTVEKLMGATDPVKMTLLSLTERLAAFAPKHYQFIKNGLKGNGFKFEQDKQYPAEYVYSVYLERVSLDLSAIQQAHMQREHSSQAVLDMLATADRLASHALSLYPESTEVITFMEESLYIRVIPYAPIALIGIPYTCTKVPRDFLAIPHEIGHYVFWRAHPLRKKILQDLGACFANTSLKFIQNWIEEIFADVYGCLIGGSALAQDMMERAIKNSLDDFWQDDGIHPTPILRPNIYTTTLRRLEMNNLADQIELEWQRISLPLLSSLAQPDQIKLGNGHLRSIQEVLSVVKAIVDIMVNRLREALLPHPFPSLWSEQWHPNLLTSFETNVSQQALQMPQSNFRLTTLPQTPNPEDPDFWFKTLEHVPGVNPALSGELPREEWHAIVRAGQWMNKGPGNPRPPIGIG